MKKILCFFGSFLSVVGGIGSLGYLLWMKEWVMAIGMVVVCYAAYPTIKNWVTELVNG